MERCTAPAESAVRWITLPIVPHGPSCRVKSPPSWALLELELHPLLHLELGQDPGRELQVRLRLGLGLGLGVGAGAGADLPVEPELQVET